MAGHELQRAKETIFLGVTIDEKLDWSVHMKNISKKIACLVGVLGRIKKFLDRKTRLLIYNCYVYPYLLYCTEVWGNTHKYLLKDVIKLQKRFIKMIDAQKPRATLSSALLFKKHKLLRLEQIYQFKIGVHMFRIFNNLAPVAIQQMCCKADIVHNYQTRLYESGFHVPKYKYTTSSNYLRVKGPMVWNSLPKAIREAKTDVTFKKAYKNHLLLT